MTGKTKTCKDEKAEKNQEVKKKQKSKKIKNNNPWLNGSKK